MISLILKLLAVCFASGAALAFLENVNTPGAWWCGLSVFVGGCYLVLNGYS